MTPYRIFTGGRPTPKQQSPEHETISALPLSPGETRGSEGSSSHGISLCPIPSQNSWRAPRAPANSGESGNMAIIQLGWILGLGSWNPEAQACASSPRAPAVFKSSLRGWHALLAIFQAWFRIHRGIYHFLWVCYVLDASPTTCHDEDLTSRSPVLPSRAIVPALLLPPLFLYMFLHWIPLALASDSWSTCSPVLDLLFFFCLYLTHFLSDLSQTEIPTKFPTSPAERPPLLHAPQWPGAAVSTRGP